MWCSNQPQDPQGSVLDSSCHYTDLNEGELVDIVSVLHMHKRLVLNPPSFDPHMPLQVNSHKVIGSGETTQ